RVCSSLMCWVYRAAGRRMNHPRFDPFEHCSKLIPSQSMMETSTALQETTMPRIAPLKPDEVPADSKLTLDAFTKNLGFTPNMMATFAASPIAFNAWA